MAETLVETNHLTTTGSSLDPRNGQFRVVRGGNPARGSIGCERGDLLRVGQNRLSLIVEVNDSVHAWFARNGSLGGWPWSLAIRPIGAGANDSKRHCDSCRNPTLSGAHLAISLPSSVERAGHGGNRGD